MEDLDPPRVVPGSAARILDDLTWLGLAWDEGPGVGGPYGDYSQSRRSEKYSAAIADLEARGHVYPCTCTRAEISRAASAPHAGEEGPRYPGTCRDPSRRRAGRPASLRLRVPDDGRARIRFVDAFAGPQDEDVGAQVGDFVLLRADGVASYQLAVTVDDVAMRVEEVVRGDDLLPSTARQILLAQLLDGAPPAYAHLPMVLGPDGERLAKRHQSKWRGSTIAELREVGVTAAAILRVLGDALGFVIDEDASLGHLIESAGTTPMRPRAAWAPPREWLRPHVGDSSSR